MQRKSGGEQRWQFKKKRKFHVAEKERQMREGRRRHSNFCQRKRESESFFSAPPEDIRGWGCLKVVSEEGEEGGGEEEQGQVGEEEV